MFQTRQLESSPSTQTSANRVSSRSRIAAVSSVTVQTRLAGSALRGAGSGSGLRLGRFEGQVEEVLHSQRL